MLKGRMAEGRRIARSFQGGADVASDARRVVRELDEQLGRVFIDAQLVISELVTNAWRHGHGRDNRPIEVTITIDPPQLGIEVRDQGAGFDHSADDQYPRDGEDGGWGLMVVDGLADDWGVRRNGDTCVWALIGIP
jgi:anti-sigma regulatory factor (Ser/Thr protein kinase)